MNRHPVLVVLIGAFLLLFVSQNADAVQGLDAHGQSKVSKAMARKWSQSDQGKDGYSNQLNKSVVNIGSKKAGDCNLNVGTVQSGQKAPKEIIVTTKEVINVCK